MPVWIFKGAVEALIGTLWSIEWNAGPYLDGDDGDWVFNVTPDPSVPYFVNLATNSDTGDVNFAGSQGTVPGGDPPQGTIQCEIQPRDNSGVTWELLTADMPTHTVQVYGPYVQDTKHTGPNGGGRTEIHPIDQIVMQYPLDDPYTIKVKLLAFSDATELSPLPWGKTAYPQYAHTDRVASLDWGWPPQPNPAATPTLAVDNLIPLSNCLSASVQQTGPPNSPRLSVVVHTGTSDQGKGMYGAVYTMSWTGAPPPPPFATCAELAAQADELQTVLDRLYGELDGATPEERKAIQGQISATGKLLTFVRAQRAAMKCK